MGAAAARWRELQEGRGIPPEILAAAWVRPWGFDPAHFRAPAMPAETPSRASGLALLVPPGSVLDVGCGGGAAGFALAERVTTLTGSDAQADMIGLFAADAQERGIAHRTVLGRWPDTAAEAGVHDVVVSNLVLHDVVELAPFLSALTAAARRGVVVEMFDRHPMAWLDPLWERFHDLVRPEPATTTDAVAVLRELGIEAEVRMWERPALPRQDATVVTRRLCLPPERIPDVAAALAGLVRPRTVATLSWGSGIGCGIGRGIGRGPAPIGLSREVAWRAWRSPSASPPLSSWSVCSPCARRCAWVCRRCCSTSVSAWCSASRCSASSSPTPI